MIVWGWVEWRRLQAGEVFQTNAPAGGSAGWTQRGGGVYVSFNVKEVWWVREPGLSNEFQRDHCCSADWVCPELKTHRRWAHELRAGRAFTAAAPCGFWLAMRFLWRCAAQTRRWNDRNLLQLESESQTSGKTTRGSCRRPLRRQNCKGDGTTWLVESVGLH